ncbi:MAG: prealbumin-like fold domain-containing protein [Actinomycetaceae bacterium]|nr:prealbumin-like fold domain-containing protein [Actinomycetaceae bacterium]
MQLRRSRILLSFIVTAVLLGISGFFIPVGSVANAADGEDKTTAVEVTKTVVTQDGKPLGDTIDPNKPFEIQMDFKFSIIKDELLGTPAAGELTKDKQVNDGDFATFKLGDNFKPKDADGTEVPVYVSAEGDPDDGKQIGTISLSQKSDGSLTAKMEFGAPSGDFNYEADPGKNVTVTFTGEFSVAAESNGEPGSQQEVVTIFDKEYKLPESVEETVYDFTKKGEIADPATRDKILWEVVVNKKSNAGKKLAGETFTDDLTDVGEYVEGSFTVNGTEVDGVYDADSKTLSYEFPADFDETSATITFATKIPKPAPTEIKNVANLSYSEEDSKAAEATVPVYQKPKITKGFSGVEIDSEKSEKALIWTIVAGTPYFEYGPAWVGDILRAEIAGQKAPKRQELVVERSLSGKPDTWEMVTTVETLSEDDAPNFPKFPADKDTPCPDLSAYKKDVYDLGLDWHEGTREATDQKYTELQNHWMFIKNLNGQYRFTVKLIFDEDTDVGSLQNDAEIHTCGHTIYPVTPPVYSGVASITKKAKKEHDPQFLNQGNIPWTIKADFSRVFPSDPRYAYELFYYGTKKDYEKEQRDTLHVEGDLPAGTFEALLEGVDGKSVVNFNQSYVEDSLQAADGDNLTAQTFAVLNADGKRIGDLLQISGFTEVKSYSFDLQTHAEDFLTLMQESDKGSYGSKYKNTVVLTTGAGPSLKSLSASALYDLAGRLLDKYAIEFNTDLDNLESVSKNGWNSHYRDYVTNIPLVDETKTFNYQDRTAMFRIDVNPTGLKLSDYAKSLGVPSEMDLKNLSVTDELPDGFSLAPLTEDGSDYFAIYEAAPISAEFVNTGGVTFEGSTEFVTFMPPGKALKRVSAEDARVEFDKENLTWNFSEYEGTPYYIVIKTKMNEEVFSNLVKDTPQGEFETYRNKVSLKAGNTKLADTGADLKIKPYLLVKEDPKVDGTLLDWTFTYKPFDQEFKNVVIEDELDENIMILLDDNGEPDIDTFDVTRSNELQAEGDYANFSAATLVKGEPRDGEVGISYDATEHKILFKLPNTPDGTTPYAYKVEYPTILRMANPTAEKIVNKVKVLASNVQPGASGEGSIDKQKYAAFARLANMPYIALKKVDKQGVALTDAVFSYEDADGKKINLISDGDGMVYLINLPENTVTVTELKAPEGFVKLSQPIVIDISEQPFTVESGLEKVAGEGSFNSPFEVPNDPTEDEHDTPDDSVPTTPSTPSGTADEPGAQLAKTGISDTTLPLGIAALMFLALGIMMVRRTR